MPGWETVIAALNLFLKVLLGWKVITLHSQNAVASLGEGVFFIDASDKPLNNQGVYPEV